MSNVGGINLLYPPNQINRGFKFSGSMERKYSRIGYDAVLVVVQARIVNTANRSLVMESLLQCAHTVRLHNLVHTSNTFDRGLMMHGAFTTSPLMHPDFKVLAKVTS